MRRVGTCVGLITWSEGAPWRQNPSPPTSSPPPVARWHDTTATTPQVRAPRPLLFVAREALRSISNYLLAKRTFLSINICVLAGRARLFRRWALRAVKTSPVEVQVFEISVLPGMAGMPRFSHAGLEKLTPPPLSAPLKRTKFWGSKNRISLIYATHDFRARCSVEHALLVAYWRIWACARCHKYTAPD